MAFDSNKFKKSSGFGEYLPNVSSEWKIKCVEENYTTLIDELKQEVDVYHAQLMAFIYKYKFEIKKNKIFGSFIIDSKGNICTVESYEKWKVTLDKNNSSEIKKQDLIPGCIYELETKNDHFIYLGKKYIIKWSFNKKTNKIEISKVQMKYIGYTVYKHNNYKIDSIDSMYILHLSTKKIVKQIKNFKDKYTLNDILMNYKYNSDILYLEDEKPTKDFEINLQLKEISINDIFKIKELYKINFINIFHEDQDMFILNNFFIHKDENNETSFSREISKSNGKVFNQPVENRMELINDLESNHSWKTTISTLGTRCKNDHYIIAPENFWILTI